MYFIFIAKIEIHIIVFQNRNITIIVILNNPPNIIVSKIIREKIIKNIQWGMEIYDLRQKKICLSYKKGLKAYKVEYKRQFPKKKILN